jgi:hypothetical protein
MSLGNGRPMARSSAPISPSLTPGFRSASNSGRCFTHHFSRRVQLASTGGDRLVSHAFTLAAGNRHREGRGLSAVLRRCGSIASPKGMSAWSVVRSLGQVPVRAWWASAHARMDGMVSKCRRRGIAYPTWHTVYHRTLPHLTGSYGCSGASIPTARACSQARYQASAWVRPSAASLFSKALSHCTPGGQLSRLIGAVYNQPIGPAGVGTVVPIPPCPTRRTPCDDLNGLQRPPATTASPSACPHSASVESTARQPAPATRSRRRASPRQASPAAQPKGGDA